MCERYWHESELTKYGHVVVSLLSSMVMSDWTTREFIVWVSERSHIVFMKHHVNFRQRFNRTPPDDQANFWPEGNA